MTPIDATDDTIAWPLLHDLPLCRMICLPKSGSKSATDGKQGPVYADIATLPPDAGSRCCTPPNPKKEVIYAECRSVTPEGIIYSDGAVDDNVEQNLHRIPSIPGKPRL